MGGGTVCSGSGSDLDTGTEAAAGTTSVGFGAGVVARVHTACSTFGVSAAAMPTLPTTSAVAAAFHHVRLFMATLRETPSSRVETRFLLGKPGFSHN